MPTVTKFKDFSLSFTRNKITNDLLVKKENAAIKQAVLNILLTEKGERLYNSDFGSDVRSYLFEPLDYGTSAQIKLTIRSTIEEFEPRIRILNLDVWPNFNDNAFGVDMTYEIVGSNEPPTAVEFFLDRTR